MLIITILFFSSDLQKCSNPVKSINGCFVTTINGQYFIVMSNLIQNPGIYNSIHYPTQSNSISFVLWEKQRQNISQTYSLQLKLSCLLNIQSNLVSFQELWTSFIFFKGKLKNFQYLQYWWTFFIHAFLLNLILGSLFSSLTVPIVTPHTDANVPHQR